MIVTGRSGFDVQISLIMGAFLILPIYHFQGKDYRTAKDGRIMIHWVHPRTTATALKCTLRFNSYQSTENKVN